MASKSSKITIFGYPSCVSTPNGGVPWDDLRNIFRGCQQMTKYQMAKKHCRKFQPAE